MKREIISEALNGLDDRHISETAVFAPDALRESPERNEYMNRNISKRSTKRFVAILIAACLVMSLGIAAYAISSIHQQRQAEIRDYLKIEENNVGSYVEQPADENADGGISILSAFNDGEKNKVFLNISPVTKEQMQKFPNELSFFWSIEDSEYWGYAGPHISTNGSLSGEEEIREAVMNGAYDAETQTLTLACYLDNKFLEKELEKEKAQITLSVNMNIGEQRIRTFGPVVYTPVESELRVFEFDSITYYSDETDKEIRLVALEITPFGAIWKTTYENAQKYSEELNYEMMDQWNTMQDIVCLETRLIFSDGEEFSIGGALSCPYENGTDNAYCSWGSAIDINAIESIVLGDIVLWENK